MRHKIMTGFAVSWLCLSLCATLHAQGPMVSDQQQLYTKSLVANCASCHGTDGHALVGSSMSSLAGLDKKFIVTQMNAFKRGTRPATVMHQLSKGFSEAQIETIATYFAAQKKQP